MAAGFLGVVKGILALCLLGGFDQSLLAGPKDGVPLQIVGELSQALSLEKGLSQSFLEAKIQKFFPNLAQHSLDASFCQACDAFVSECTSQKGRYLPPMPRVGALKTAPPTARLLEGCVAYLHLPAPHLQSIQKDAYVRALRKLIRRLGRFPLKGWILDLRDCDGDDPQTLLAGCVDLLEEGLLGFIESEREGDPQPFLKENTTLLFQKVRLGHGERPPSGNFKRPAKMAVLQGRETKSAGEVLVLALHSQKATRTFGEKTAGDLVFYQPLFLKAGGCLLRAQGRFLDDKGVSFPLGFLPDVETPEASPKEDVPLHQALLWILEALLSDEVS